MDNKKKEKWMKTFVNYWLGRSWK